MKQSPLLWILQMGLLSSCASTQICTRPLTQSEPEAQALVLASQKAHGSADFAKINDLSVRYEGKWAAIGPRFQPVLVDSKFRGGSEERLILAPRIIAQSHTGPGGIKNVLRQPDQIAILHWNSLQECRSQCSSGSRGRCLCPISAWPVLFPAKRHSLYHAGCVRCR